MEEPRGANGVGFALLVARAFVMRVARRWLVFTLILPVLGLVALVGVGSREPGSSSAERKAVPVRVARARVSSPSAAAPDASPRAREAAELARESPPVQLTAALEPFLSRLLATRQAGDENGARTRRAELSSFIAKDPGAALAALLAELRVTGDEAAAGLILDVLTSEEALPHPEVLAALCDMASHDDVPFHRELALHGLGELPDGGADRVTQVAELARRERDPEVRETAAVALGALGDRSPGPVARSAAGEIVDSLATETDPRVRACFLYALRDTRDQRVADALLGALGDPDQGVRLAAADMLGDVAALHRDQAVSALATRFEQETDPQLRRTIVAAIVRAGRMGALPVLTALPGGEEQPFIDDFVAGLRDGEDNMEKLYALRAAREKAR